VGICRVWLKQKVYSSDKRRVKETIGFPTDTPGEQVLLQGFELSRNPERQMVHAYIRFPADVTGAKS
jgi:hypothetical protein